jgi:hypothetical protein
MKHGIYFLAGAFFWAVALGLLAVVLMLIGPGLSGASSSSSLSLGTIALVLVGFAGFTPVYLGINFAAETLFGRQANKATGLVILLIAFTVIGLLPVAYWTGTGLVRRLWGEP